MPKMTVKLVSHRRYTVVVILFCIVNVLGDISTYDRSSDCSWIQCYNMGTIALLEQQCVCNCRPGYSGILCEYEMNSSRWPDGPYALLMPLSGCPEGETYGWSPGYINITTLNAIEILFTSKGSISVDPFSESPTNLEGPFGNYTIQLNFCFKHRNWSTDEGVSWPSDRVNVFGMAEGCPKGMTEALSVISLPPIRSWWSDGYLPFFEIHTDDNGTIIYTTECKQSDAESHVDINTEPFIFVKDQDSNCKAIETIEVAEETLTFIDRNGAVQTISNISFCTFIATRPRPPTIPPEFVVNEMAKCQKPFGLTDGTIEDYQFMSSSWDQSNTPHMARLGDIGWCPAVDDLNPYLQVDLFSIGLVGGITLYNRVNYIETVQSNVYNRRLVPEGCLSFMISYGIYSDHLTNYTERPFTVDYSQAYEQPQTFKFMRPLLVRFVRIYPLKPIGDGRLCLRLELLGCSSPAKLTSTCNKDSHAYWIPLSSITPASIFAEHSLTPDNTSLEDCQRLCEQQIGECKAIQYISNKTCGLYNSPFPGSSLSTRLEPQPLEYLLVCINESAITEYIVIATNNEVETHIAVIDRHVLTSYGYPMHYDSNTVFKWTIYAVHGGYIRLTFAVIDFYDRSIEQSTACPEDKLTFNEAFNPITSFQNGLTPTFPTEENKLDLVFNTCARKYRRDDRRAGFKIFVEIEDSPTIWNKRYFISGMESGHILSHTLLGVNGNRPESQQWTIRSRWYGGPYLLTFWHFDIPCSDGSYLTLTDIRARYGAKLCNSMKKPDSEYRTWYMFITYSYLKDVPDLREEIGFGVYFRAVPIFKSAYLSTHFDGGELVGQPPANDGENYVCSRELQKCYMYNRRGHEDYTGWTTHAKFCRSLGYNQIIIHTRKEVEFLQGLILDMEKDHLASWDDPDPPYQIYTHIGLIGYQEKNRLHYIWEDGTSVTFSIWGHGEPSSTDQTICTGMNIDLTTGDATWISRSCSSPTKPDNRYFEVFTSVCEKPYEPMKPPVPAANVNTEEITTNVEPGFKDLLFQCISTEWVSYTAVCDGISNCNDGSDEVNCDLHQTGNECLSDEFACGNGICIHIGHVCDYTADCLDGSDEYCMFPECGVREYTCANKQCLPDHIRCDAVEDCHDGSDERLCESCNNTIAFSCGDLTCIPRSMVCNGVPDCEDGRDETDCTNTYQTCYDYWNDGYSRNLTFNYIVSAPISSFFLECKFYWADANTLQVTSVLDWAFIWSGMNANRMFATVPADFFKEHGQICIFEISERCKYHLSEVASYIDPDYNGSYSFCRPRRVLFHTDGYQPWQSETTDTFRDIKFKIDDDVVELQRLQHTLIDFQTSVLANISTRIGPVVCTAEYLRTSINCGDGMTVSLGRRCLYGITRSGIIDGCRNFKHLENCEQFPCPSGYIKCYFSFCLAQQFVCDGERQCPGGEDEENCWDGGVNITLAVVFHETPSEYIKSVIFKFARQFYSATGDLYALRYFRHNTIIVGNMRAIHPYNEALNLADRSSFDTNSSSIASGIVDFFGYRKGINIIHLEVDRFAKDLSIDIVSNISEIDHVYHIRIDETIPKQVSTSRYEKDTHIVVKNIDVLASIGSKLFPWLKRESTAVGRSGDFKCISSEIHIPSYQTCDGIVNCPYGDDEAVCDFQCLEICSCEPYIANCLASGLIEVEFARIDSTTRILDISNNSVFEEGRLSIPKQFPFLIKLYAKNCKLSSIKDKTFTNATSLTQLDLSFNEISALRKDTFVGLKYIKVLNLRGNNVLSVIEPTVFRMLGLLRNLSITKKKLSEIMSSTFSGLKLETLDISNNEIHTIHAYAFNNLTVRALNFEGNEIVEFDAKLFFGVQNLSTVRTPSFKFCCYKPSSVQTDSCWPHDDEFSSCEDLMRNSILQTLLWMIGVAAIVANGATIAYRLIHDRRKVAKGFGLFVLNLAASDFLMGVYLIIIATADLIFRNRYILEDDYWRKSFWCNIAGILATVSSEASVGFMCLITVERFLVIRYPFGQWRFNARASRVAVTINWLISLMIALVPIMIKDYFEDSFYSTSGVCLAMPLTSRRPPGWIYSFIIYVAVNFVVFILIAIGQLAIYLEIKQSTKRMEQYTSQRRNEMSIARNLLLVLTTDFLCWFPIGVMAIMAYDGYSIPGDVYAWTAVLILPVNSALNPFLYTLSAVVGLKNSKKSSASYETTRKTGGDILRVEGHQ